MTKRILITGGAGFIGSNLCRKLAPLNIAITCVDNLSTGSINNIKDLIKLDNFKFIEHDITRELQGEFDEIYNLACPASPPHYQKDPIKTMKTNVLGIVNLLELAKSCNAKILQASTSEVYGNPLIHPQKEEYSGNVNPIGIRSCYDEGKRAAETLMTDYNRMYNTDIRVARIFNTYGPNMAQDDGRVVSNFIVQALKNEDITIYGNGSQTRSFCYIDDLLSGIIGLMNSNCIEPVNIGNDGEFTVLELAKTILKLTNSNSKIVYKPLPSDDPVMRKPDLSKAKKMFNYAPTVKLEEGLLKTIKYFEAILKGTQ